MEHNASINELPFEILMEIFEYFTIPEIARFPMTCTHWRDLMQQDHFWTSLARKTYGQYVGETPKKKQLEELSKRCGQELTFMHWLQYRSLFGLTMNMAVHVGLFMPDDAFDYKVTLEPGLNMERYTHKSWRRHDLGDCDGVSATFWESTFYVVITPEVGKQIRKEIPLISIQEMTSRQQIRHSGKIYKFKLKLTKMLQEFLSSVRGTVIYPIEDSQFKAIVQLKEHLRGEFHAKTALEVLLQFKFDLHRNTDDFYIANVGFKSHLFKRIYRYENPFIYAPACMHLDTDYVVGRLQHFVYQNLKLHEYIPIMAKNFNEVIKSQVQLYLAEIVCGFEFLHSHSLYLKDCIPVIKKDGHLQFVYAGPRDIAVYSYFGLAPEKGVQRENRNPRDMFTPFQTDSYALGIFLLEVCSGEVLTKHFNRVTEARVPHGLSVELQELLSTLLAKDFPERPKNIAAIKKSAYFKGIDWQRMRRQDWSPKFLPNLE